MGGAQHRHATPARTGGAFRTTRGRRSLCNGEFIMDMTLAKPLLDGASDTGAGGLKLSVQPLRGMITLRADLSDAAVASAVKAATGSVMPGIRKATDSVLWMSPDELLLLCPYGEQAATIAKLTDELVDTHHLAADVSDARTLFRLEGDAAREVLAKGAPVDLARDRFTKGDLRRTRISHVAAAFWQSGDSPDVFEIVCFRSYARYLWLWLQESSREGTMPKIL